MSHTDISICPVPSHDNTNPLFQIDFQQLSSLIPEKYVNLILFIRIIYENKDAYLLGI